MSVLVNALPFEAICDTPFTLESNPTVTLYVCEAIGTKGPPVDFYGASRRSLVVWHRVVR